MKRAVRAMKAMKMRRASAVEDIYIPPCAMTRGFAMSDGADAARLFLAVAFAAASNMASSRARSRSVERSDGSMDSSFAWAALRASSKGVEPSRMVAAMSARIREGLFSPLFF